MAALVVALTGCALGPGPDLKLDDGWQSGTPSEPEVVVRDISPRVLAEMEAAVQVQQGLPSWLTDYRPDTYRFGSGDILNITVWDHPELTVPAGTQFNGDANGRVIRQDGTLYYPYVGAIQAAGLDPDELRTELARRLVRFIDRPQVDVSVQKYGSQRVFLSGAFQRTEPMAITNVPLPLSEVVGKAGINTLEADLSGLQLRRGNRTVTLDLDALARQGTDLQQVLLKAGDSLFLPYADRKKVYVMGEVGTPRALSFKTTTVSLTDVLGSVSGLRPETSKATSVYVIRGAPTIGPMPTHADVYRLNANRPLDWVLAGRFPLYAGDIVYVGPAGVTRFNRLLSQLLPSASLLQTTAIVQSTKGL